MLVLLYPKAGKSLARLDRAAKSRILYRLENLSKDHPEGDMLKGRCGFRLRVAAADKRTRSRNIGNAAVRKRETHGFIGKLPEYNVDRNLKDDGFVIETDLTDEERALIAKGMADYEKDPSSFIPLKDIL
jgi:hypothetical protein